MSEGRNTTLNVLLDAVAVADRAAHQSRMVLHAIDDSIKIDMSDDDHWKEADEAISLAREFAGEMPGGKRKTDLMAELLKAQSALRKGMTIDFADVSKEKLKALIVPDQTALEQIGESFKTLIKKLERNHG